MYGKGSIRSFFDYSSFSRSIEKAKVGSGGAAAARATYGQMSIFGGGPPLHSTPLRSHIILAHSFTPLRPSWLLRLLLRRMYEGEASNQWGYCRRPNNQSVWPGNICRGFLFSLLQDVCNM